MKVLWMAIAISVVAPAWIVWAADSGKQQELDQIINEIEEEADPAGPPIENAVKGFREMKESNS